MSVHLSHVGASSAMQMQVSITISTEVAAHVTQNDSQCFVIVMIRAKGLYVRRKENKKKTQLTILLPNTPSLRRSQGSDKMELMNKSQPSALFPLIYSSHGKRPFNPNLTHLLRRSGCCAAATHETRKPVSQFLIQDTE